MTQPQNVVLTALSVIIIIRISGHIEIFLFQSYNKSTSCFRYGRVVHVHAS